MSTKLKTAKYQYILKRITKPVFQILNSQSMKEVLFNYGVIYMNETLRTSVNLYVNTLKQLKYHKF